MPQRPSSGAPDPVVQGTAAAVAAPATTSSFNGIGNGFTGPAGAFMVNSAPPDPNSAIGPNHIVEVVNTDVAIFNKSGTAVFGPVPINTLWNGFGGGCETNSDGDPVARYDAMADRWIITQFSVSTTPFLECLAVSQTGDPTGSYYRYAFQYANFPDYPKLGVWPDAYYLTYNDFNAAGTAFLGAEVCALDRARMLQGLSATQQCFTTSTAYGGLLPADLAGTTVPPAGAPNVIVGLGASVSTIAWWKFHVDFATPAATTFTGPTEIPVAAFAEACTGGTCIPQSGTTQRLDSLADRMMFSASYRNFGDHESIVVSHAVTAGASVGVRWYELRLPGGTPTVFQQGTYAPDASYRWMSSMAMDASGNIGLGFSLSSSTLRPALHYTGRLAGDALGTMTQGEGSFVDGAGSQTSGLARWGDYSSLSIDPSDGCTFWYTGEYEPADGSFNWATRIGSFRFPSCSAVAADDFSISANPSAVSASAGTSTTSTISTAVAAGGAQSIDLSAAGLPAGATATFDPATITAGGSSTLTISTDAATPTGPFDITVTATGASATHTTNVALTVDPAISDDFSIAADPTSVTVTAGDSGTSTVSTAVTSGNAQSVDVSISGLPVGATADFSPASLTAGGSSTLTLSSDTTTAPGSYDLVITGTGPSATHTTPVTLVVNAPVANDFSVIANPTSGSVTAGASTDASIDTAITSGNAQTISLSATGLPSGTTASFSPNSISAGASATLTLATSSFTPAGAYTVTITATGSSQTHTTTYSLTVNAPIANDFSVTANPTSGSVTASASTSASIDTAITSGNAQTISLSATGLPAGTTASFSPSSISAGASATLTLATSSSTPAGTSTITITATGSSQTHTTTYSLTVNAPVLTNGGFEAGNLSGWTVTGVESATTRTPRTGAFADQAGAATPTNGDSSIAQTFTVPVGPTQISFWYRMTCRDTVRSDWATATLRDNTANTLAIVLRKTCATNSSYVHVTAGVIEGHSYTLTLTNHDDNGARDASFTRFDDVALVVAALPPALTNGGFEAGNLSGWTVTGAESATTRTPRTGTYADQSGAATPTNGDSSLAQAFTVPAGAGTLSFWYRMSCPDTVTFDWATATLRDNTANTTTVVLPRTCSTNSSYVHVTAAVIAGHSYTLTLTNHDDGHPRDGSFTRFDDVSVL